MTVATTRFGNLNVSTEDIFELTAPMLGFPETREFVFINRDDIAPFRWLQSVQSPGLTLVVVEPRHFFRKHKPFVPQWELSEVGAESLDDVTLYSVVNIPEDLEKMTANLRRPIIVNRRTGQMKQIRTSDEKYTFAESVLQGIKEGEAARADIPEYEIYLN